MRNIEQEIQEKLKEIEKKGIPPVLFEELKERMLPEEHCRENA